MKPIFASQGSRSFLLAAIFLLAIILRIPFIIHHPEGFHKGRQYYDLLISRGIYYKYFADHSEEPAWKKSMAILQGDRQEFLEPPVFQGIVATAYALVGRELVTVSRIIAVVIWFLGALAIYRLVLNVMGFLPAALSGILYLFFPYGLVMSTSFQPDSLMITAALWALHQIIQLFERDSFQIKIYLSAIFFSFVAIFIKPLCLFPIFFSFAFLAWQQKGLVRSILNVKNWVFYAVVTSPLAFHYLYRILLGDFMQWQFQVSILPHLIFTKHFWMGWKAMLGIVCGYFPVFFAWLGVLFIPHKQFKALMIGYFVGFICFGFTFTLQIHTHEYYQLMLIPWICIGIAALICRLRIPQLLIRSNWVCGLCLVFCIPFLGVKFNNKIEYVTQSYQFPEMSRVLKKAYEIGELTQHSAETILLAGTWGEGKIVQFYGWITTWDWPSMEQLVFERLRGIEKPSASDRFQTYFKQLKPKYFVIEDMNQLALQGDLKMFLDQNFSVHHHGPDYLIYDLQKPKRI